MHEAMGKHYDEEYLQLIKEHGVCPTANRILVARALGRVGRPTSQKELEDILKTLDKSSISRCLTLFKAHHLVHVLEDGSEAVRYELCRSHSCQTDDDLHVHFYCEVCGRTFCMSDIPIPLVRLPEDYTLHSVNYMAKGVCASCRNKN